MPRTFYRSETRSTAPPGGRKLRSGALAPTKTESTLLFAIIPLLIVAFVFSQAIVQLDQNGYAVWLVAWGIATFVTYGLDKTLARLGWWRVPEILLHILSVVGGFAGGWLGMFVFWHKVRKTSFWIVLLASTAVHGAIVYWLYVRGGSLPW
jgi:uncharacterized membrane protein YsdA (DUF1294 family)